MLEVDGAHGEGGGQILRSSLALSMVLGQPICIRNIRAKRKRSGLAAQHLTCVQAAAEICDADVSGDTLGSKRITFVPGPVRPGDYDFDIQTAGSTSLVFQTVFLPLAFADAPSRIVLRGGTHVPWSPCFHYLRDVFLPAMQRMRLHAELRLERWGWYPQGGGIVHMNVQPQSGLQPLSLMERGPLVSVHGISALSNLEPSIALRQKRSAMRFLCDLDADVQIAVEQAPSIGKGTVVFLMAQAANGRNGFTAVGKRGKPAERVGEEAARSLLRFLTSGAAVDAHLADQLVLPMALVSGTSEFTTPVLTTHLSTNLWLVQQFLPDRFQCEGTGGIVHVKRLP